MKILIVHNNYGKYSGEEAVVDKMSEMFKSHGHEVMFYRKTTEGERDSLSGKIKGFFSGIYSPSGVEGMRKALEQYKPDIVNVHNLYPFISPAALFECRKAGVPVIMTIHNFRLICPTGLFMRNGLPCETCLEKGNEWSCIRYNCEKSLLKSTGYTLRNFVARETGAYRKCVMRFACITEFQKKKLIQAGYEKGKVIVIPNSIDIKHDDVQYTEGEYVAYIGRLSYEKGYDLLFEIARRNPNIRFCFAGATRDSVDGELPDNIELKGYLRGSELDTFITKAKFVVMPSRCYEGFPMAILEAAQHKKPTIGPDHGGFTEIIGKGDDAIGLLFKPNDIDDLEKQITVLWDNSDSVKTLGEKAYSKLLKNYSSEVIYRKWESLIDDIIRK